MEKISIATFRASLVHATLATAPMTIKLSSMSPAIEQLQLTLSAVPDNTLMGWRLRDRLTTIVPDMSDDSNITTAANEAGWAPFPNTDMRLDLYGYVGEGTPWEVYLDFYNNTSSTDIVVSGLLLSREPQHTIHDLIVEMSKMREQFDARGNFNPSQYVTK